jgi:hypothetical protein
MAERKSGYYWVKFAPEPDVWVVARWDDAMKWWFFEPSADSRVDRSDWEGRWSEIGPYIPTPDERPDAHP